MVPCDVATSEGRPQGRVLNFRWLAVVTGRLASAGDISTNNTCWTYFAGCDSPLCQCRTGAQEVQGAEQAAAGQSDLSYSSQTAMYSTCSHRYSTSGHLQERQFQWVLREYGNQETIPTRALLNYLQHEAQV